jgi:hypothetical protein
LDELTLGWALKRCNLMMPGEHLLHSHQTRMNPSFIALRLSDAKRNDGRGQRRWDDKEAVGWERVKRYLRHMEKYSESSNAIDWKSLSEKQPVLTERATETRQLGSQQDLVLSSAASL